MRELDSTCDGKKRVSLQDEFITSLYALAKHCGYDQLHDEMIRDRIVVGIRNIALSEKLQLKADLTLEMAIQTVRQGETVRQQQSLLRMSSGTSDTLVGTVHKTGKTRRPYKGLGTQKSGARGTTKGSQPHVRFSLHTRYGKSPAHDRQHCPAKDAECRKCKKRGHYQAVCRSTANISGVHSQGSQHHKEHKEDLYDAFMGAVGGTDSSDTNPWVESL